MSETTTQADARPVYRTRGGRPPITVTHEELAKEWHPSKNGDLTADDVTHGSERKVWWVCADGHEWEAAIAHRARGAGCPVHAGHTVVAGFNDLKSQNPDLAAEWHPTRNEDVTPDRVTTGTNQRVWWVCADGHEWQAKVASRTRGTGCPVHAGRAVLAGVNDLKSQNSDLAAEWHPTRNGDLGPDQVTTGSGRKVWWRCTGGHEWEATVAERTRGAGCPVHAGQTVLAGVNDLKSQNSELAAEWHPTRNGDLGPDQVTTRSNRKVWWRCTDGHEWQATVSSRAQGNGCPAHAGKAVSAGFNDLRSQNSNLAAEWHPTRNDDLGPDQVTTRSGLKVWWRCTDGHEWQATVCSRAAGNGCPVHAGKAVLAGFNDLRSQNSNLAAEWHPTRNGELGPDQVTTRSGRKVWWVCRNCGREWEARITDRTQGKGKCVCQFTLNTARKVIPMLEGLVAVADGLGPAELALCVQQSPLGKRDDVMKAVRVGGAAELRRLLGVLTESELEPDQNDVLDPGADVVGDRTAEPAAAPAETSTNPREDVLGDDALVVDDFQGGSHGPADDPVGDALAPLGGQDAQSVLDSLEVMAGLASGSSEALADLVASRSAAIWRGLYGLDPQDVPAAVDALRGHHGNAFVQAFCEDFLAEFDAAYALVPPAGWSFLPDPAGPVVQPNLMQRHAAVMVQQRRCAGNWSGTGAGKTVSAVLASRIVGAGHDGINVVVCPNNTVDGWARTITGCYPDSRVATRTLDPVFAPGDGPRWLVVNYELLVARKDQVDGLLAFGIDFLVVDEVHLVKQRGATKWAVAATSQRRQLVNRIRTQAAQANPDLHVLVLSATPVVNDLTEAVSLLELVHGAEQGRLATTTSFGNALAVHFALVRAGFRWKPEYAARLEVTYPQVDVGHLVDDLATEIPAGRWDAALSVECHDEIVAAVAAAKARGRGVLVYTETIEDIIDPLAARLSAEGFVVGEYTGRDKADIDTLVADGIDVVIGTSAIGTGVDGLQHWADTVVFACLPWTRAEFEQIIGRVHRQGQDAGTVRVIIPTGYADVVTPDGATQRWSWTEQRMARIRHKQTLADCAVDGQVPRERLVSPDAARRSALSWLRTLRAGEQAA